MNRTDWKCKCCGREIGTDDHRDAACSRCRNEERLADAITASRLGVVRDRSAWGSVTTSGAGRIVIHRSSALSRPGSDG